MLMPALVLVLHAQTAVAQPDITWLAMFAGVWETEDTYYPVNGAPIVERATRTCEPVMQGSYMQCETVVTRAGGGRTYRFLINYNRNTKRFEMLSLWSNVPHKAVQSLTPDVNRTRWILEDVAEIGGDGDPSDHWSELIVESPQRMVWTGRRVTGGADPRSAPVSFREVWIRVKG